MPKAGKSDVMKRLQKLLEDAVSTGQFSVAGIADKTGLEVSLVYKYLRGDRPGTSLDTFLALVSAVGKHPSDVLGEPKKAVRAPDSVLRAHEEIGKFLRGK